MNREEVIELAREAGWTQYSLLQSVEVQRLEKFASLVVAHEREACANRVAVFDKTFQTGGVIAYAIRARGEE